MPGSTPVATAGAGAVDSAPPGERTAADLRWTLGAGLGFGGGGVFVAENLGGTVSPSLLTPRVALERRLGENTWLLLNALVNYSSFEERVISMPPPSGGGTSPDDRKTLAVSTTQLSALLGIRQVVAHGIVDLSLSFAAGVSRTSVGGDSPRGTETLPSYTPGSRAHTVGGVAGLVLERQLLRALALRLSTDLVGASFGKNERLEWVDGEYTRGDYTSGSVRFLMSPSLYLHFYF